MKPTFEVIAQTNRVYDWAQDFLQSHIGKPLVIGISGGKDSTIATALLCQVVGKRRVLGVLMPNAVQPDIDVSKKVCKFFGIQSIECDIGPMYRAMLQTVKTSARNFYTENFNEVVTTNAPARCRMSMLYTIANQLGGRVVNTCNLSESFVGWDTKFGDQCGDFGLFTDYTVSEVKKIGYELGVPAEFIEKAPDDGMCGKTDEEKFGFSYDYLDAWIRRGGRCENETDKKIITMHLKALHKIPTVSFPHPKYLPDGSHSLFLSGEDCLAMLKEAP